MTRKIRESIDDFKTYQEFILVDQPTLYDDFSADHFNTSVDGFVSPNGKWQVKYLGYGYAKTVTDPDGSNRLEVSPKLDDGKEHAVAILSTKTFTGIHGKFAVRLDAQRRFTFENGQSHPQAWDTFWAMLAHVNDTTHIYFNIKTNGWEIGKKDNDHPASEELQEYIMQGNLPLAILGDWYIVEFWVVPVKSVGRLRIKVIVNGKVLADLLDNQKSQRNGTISSSTSDFFLNSDQKRFGVYSEQSKTSWKEIYLQESSSV